MCAVEAIQGKDGCEYIIEVGWTSGRYAGDVRDLSWESVIIVTTLPGRYMISHDCIKDLI